MAVCAATNVLLSQHKKTTAFKCQLGLHTQTTDKSINHSPHPDTVLR